MSGRGYSVSLPPPPLRAGPTHAPCRRRSPQPSSACGPCPSSGAGVEASWGGGLRRPAGSIAQGLAPRENSRPLLSDFLRTRGREMLYPRSCQEALGVKGPGHRAATPHPRDLTPPTPRSMLRARPGLRCEAPGPCGRRCWLAGPDQAGSVGATSLALPPASCPCFLPLPSSHPTPTPAAPTLSS